MHVHDDHGRLFVRDGAVTLAEYVYEPTEATRESPRPYALLRSRSDVSVTAYRPSDHLWHKGLSLALPVVGPHNFWGGPTYVHGDGYVQLPNNGTQRHKGAEVRVDADGVARVEEALDWIAESGELVLEEERTLTARIVDDTTWALTWRSARRNVSRAPLGFGSPTSKGRENAGYAGIFWRGPVDFTGGEIVSPVGGGGDGIRGEPGPWLAFIAPDRDAGILMIDASDPVTGTGNPWFARSEEYAGLNPSPFFHTDTLLPAGETLVLAAALVVGDVDVADLAPTVGAALVAEIRAHLHSRLEETPA